MTQSIELDLREIANKFANSMFMVREPTGHDGAHSGENFQF